MMLVVGVMIGVVSGLETWTGDPRAYVRVRLCGMGSFGEGPACFVTTDGSRATAVALSPESAPALRNEQAGRGRGSALVDRDGGFYDNAPWDFLGGGKRECFDRAKYGRMGFASPYLRLVTALEEQEIQVIEALVEDAWPLRGRVVFEGAVRVARGDADFVVDCATDEAVGLSLASKCPLLMAREIWALTAAPYRTLEDGDLAVDAAPLEKGEGKVLSPYDSIKTSAEYLRMSLEERLGVIVAAGLKPPRPRNVTEATVDAVLLPKVDEIVRREVLIDRALGAGDVKLANQLAAGKSERHRAADEAREASEWGDIGAEAGARARLAVLEAVRADPTQDVGSYDPYLDQDPWYEEQRRRLM